MTDKTTEKTPRVRQYDGPDDSSSLSRGISNAENMWNMDKEFQLGTLDELLSSVIQNVLDRKSKSLQLLDIGSGPEGRLLSELATKPDLLVKTHALLQKNPELQIFATGLTDAESKETFLQATPLQIPESEHTQIHAQNVEYSVTDAQTLEDFFQEKKIDTLDLVLATFSLTYLGPKAFEQTMRAVIKKLSLGGKFIAAGYAEDHPAIKRNEMSQVKLKTRNKHDDLIALDYRKFDEKFYQRTDKKFRIQMNDQEFLELIRDLEKAEEYLEKIGTQDPSFLAKLKRNTKVYFQMLSGIYYDLKNKREITLNSLRADYISQRRLLNVSRPIWDLEKKLLRGMRQKKKMILEQLAKEFGDQIEIKFSDHIFEITKKVK